ncbi:MAG: hypothetical protein CMM24_07840 [Rhodospirillaceae bacterium]|nr:hypothetical protein [Rhodospirillaceae bacterium]|tara:strand:+ start:503 stop:745 length:243 start_codon:yes stop_codon:yes gene_type:complete
MPDTNDKSFSKPSDKASNSEQSVVDPKLLDILVCPLSKTPLVYDKKANELISKSAGLAFPIRNGVPILLVDEARQLDEFK